FILISVIVYIQSPLSDVKTVNIEGNDVVSDEDITAMAQLNDSPNIWTISKNKMEQKIMGSPLIQSVEIDKKLPQTVKISIKEHDLVGYIKQNEYYLPVLE